MDKEKALTIAKKYVNFLRANDFHIERAYLFGSCAKGVVNEDSDIDLAVVFRELPDSFDMQVQLMKLRRRFDMRIEPHPFKNSDFNASNPFANEVLNTGLQVV